METDEIKKLERIGVLSERLLNTRNQPMIKEECIMQRSGYMIITNLFQL